MSSIAELILGFFMPPTTPSVWQWPTPRAPQVSTPPRVPTPPKTPAPWFPPALWRAAGLIALHQLLISNDTVVHHPSVDPQLKEIEKQRQQLEAERDRLRRSVPWYEGMGRQRIARLAELDQRLSDLRARERARLQELLDEIPATIRSDDPRVSLRFELEDRIRGIEVELPFPLRGLHATASAAPTAPGAASPAQKEVDSALELDPEILARLAIQKGLPKSTIVAILSSPTPGLIVFIRTWLVLDPKTLFFDMGTFIEAVKACRTLTDDAIYVLSTQARSENIQIGGAFARLLNEMPQFRPALIRMMHNDPVFWPHIPWKALVKLAKEADGTPLRVDILDLMREVGESARAFLGELEPAERTATVKRPASGVELGMTAMDMRGGREAHMVSDLLAGRRQPSPGDIQQLILFAGLGVSGAVDALYQIAWRGGALGQQAADALTQISKEKGARHQHTVQLMVGALGNKATDPSGVRPVSVAAQTTVEALYRHIALNPLHAGLFVRQLMGEVARGDVQAASALIDLMASQDARVSDVLAKTMVAMVEEGTLDAHVLKEIIRGSRLSQGRTALLIQLRTGIETRHAPRLEPLRELLR